MYEGRRVLAGRYRLDERIGAGGMGAVWRATDTVLGRTVAVKLMLATLLDEPDFERRFLFEARAMASLRHPGVVAIHDYRSDAEGAFLVMEYVEGEALSRRSAGTAGCPRSTPCTWWRRRPTRSPPPTRRASCTATSSRGTSCSGPTARSC